MPRQMRKRSRTGIYHVMVRGNSGQSLFEYDEDNQRFLEILAETKEKMNFEIDLFAYCLMGNHVHLLLHENNAMEHGDGGVVTFSAPLFNTTKNQPLGWFFFL